MSNHRKTASTSTWLISRIGGPKGRELGIVKAPDEAAAPVRPIP
jgi:hypothetical protein